MRGEVSWSSHLSPGSMKSATPVPPADSSTLGAEGHPPKPPPHCSNWDRHWGRGQEKVFFSDLGKHCTDDSIDPQGVSLNQLLVTNLLWILHSEMASARLIFLLKSENMLPRANGIILTDATPVCALSFQ